MFRRMVILSTLLMLFSRSKTQFHLYRTDHTDRIDLHYDCLYYRIRDDSDSYWRFINYFESSYEVIPYCIRPFEEKEHHKISGIRGNTSSNFTFDALKRRNVSSQDLLVWSAPIEIAEHYENFLNQPNPTSALELFYNCTSLWFGPFCQYTFDSNETIDQIVQRTFLAKKIDIFGGMNVKVPNFTCYVHLECNRGLPPICLDWREICDGRIDCIGTGIDEIGCLELETNECEENEYRCHRGMCVPVEFWNDNPYNPDCLDRTDENDDNALKEARIAGSSHCFQDPAFRCEESDYFYGLRGFVCGDGENIQISKPLEEIYNVIHKLTCRNNRGNMLYESALLDIQRSSKMSFECCSTVACFVFKRNVKFCFQECGGENYSCSFALQTVCNHSKYILFPVLPILQGYAQFGFWANTTIKPFAIAPLPDFVCYDSQRCPFLPSTFKVDNLACSSIREMDSVNVKNFDQIFHLCLSMDQNGNETDCFHPSLFHCPGSSKCISKHRLLDGVFDCNGFADEQYTETCQLNQTHRFQCSSEDKCLAPVLVLDGIEQCNGGDDELPDFRRKFPFQNFCNGFPQLPAMIIDGQEVTDETNCTQWPCNNEYTRCDFVWDCPNGADELNCDPESECNPDGHECVSLINSEIICLPLNRAGDGVIDCLGSTDEREFCREMDSAYESYRCWNDSHCTVGGCVGVLFCPFDRKIFSGKTCEEGSKIDLILRGPSLDRSMRDLKARKNIYFTLSHLDRLIRTSRNSSAEIIEITDTEDSSSFEILRGHSEFFQAWLCNRGILVYHGLEKAEHCLCPPSYYGDRCQFQSQRVSLTLQFRKECAPVCRGIYAIMVMLVDSDQQIHSHDRFTYISTDHCDMKYNIYLLYQHRPKSLTKNYTIRITAYNKMDLSYYTSWILPVKLLFLPVNRIGAYLFIPAAAVDIANDCPLKCGIHGHCSIYTNIAAYFCRCDSGWTGIYCTIKMDECDCSSDSICLGIESNRSICICPLTKIGPRCILSSVCRENLCQNNGQCVPDDYQISPSAFKCICKGTFSGRLCEEQDTQVDVLFQDNDIFQSLFLHFITIQSDNNPLITTVSAKIAFNQNIATVYIPMAFNLIFVQIMSEYYLAFLQVNSSRLDRIALERKSFKHCGSTQQLFNQEILDWHRLHRVKLYHTICQNRTELSCFYDNEAYMCLCNADRHANCFPFDFNKTSVCSGRTVCENGAQCLPDRLSCPTLTMCICTECFYGGKCQFTTKGFSLSLDVILGYQIQPHLSIADQSTAVKVSIAVATIMFLTGLLNSLVSVMTFHSHKLRQVGCGLYLFTLSILSSVSATMFALKLFLLIISQISQKRDHTFLSAYCFSGDFLLQSLLTSGDWLTACVAIERGFTAVRGVNFNQKRSKRVARWIIITVLLISFISMVHDPIHRQLINDEQEQRIWCIVRYSPGMKIYNSIVQIIHFIIPFLTNLISALVVILTIARTHSTARKNQTYQQYIRQELQQQKHLIISPLILVLFALPRLIISFLSGCMKSARDPWLFLFGYFISFIPPLLTFIVFIWPSESYKKEFSTIIKHHRMAIRQRLNVN